MGRSASIDSISQAQSQIANGVGMRHNDARKLMIRRAVNCPATQVNMSDDSGSAGSEQAFLRVAAANGLDTSDAERMEDLRNRVLLMRQGLARVYEIDVSGAESPSVFVPARR